MFGVAVAMGLAAVVLLWLEYGSVRAGVVVALIIVVLLGGAELQAALRLNWSLREFASQVPGTPEASASPRGDQTVRWPDLGLAASGGTHRFRVRGLTVDVDGLSRSASTLRPREAAREALETLGREPAFRSFDDRLPSVYPRLSALRAGAGVGVVALLLAGLADPVTPGGASGVVVAVVASTPVLAAALRWAGLVRVRQGLVALSEGLREGGVSVDRIDLVGGIVAPAVSLTTDEGTVAVRSVAHPWGRVRATVGDRSVEGRLPEVRSVGRDAAALLREGADGEARVDSSGLVTTGRVFSAAFGACSVGVGALLVGRPGVVVGGECTRACLFEAALGTVPFLNAAVGGLLVLLGLAALAVAAGRLPVPGW